MGNESPSFRVLVVDDDPSCRVFLARYLNSIHYDVRVAEDARVALPMMLDWRPHIVLSDLSMPEIDGLELCRCVRSEPTLEGTHFIMLTAHDSSDQMIEAFAAGVDDFVTKPIDLAELTARMRASERVLRTEEQLASRILEAQRYAAELTVLNERLHKVTITDELTGLHNRRHAVAKLNDFWNDHRRSLAVATLDVDLFKAINDLHGHDTGDMVLKDVSNALVRTVGSDGIVCRTGGDEMLVLMPGKTDSTATAIAESCRAAVAATSTVCRDRSIKATISVGVAVRTERMSAVSDLLRAAD